MGFGLELASGGPGYYCHANRLRHRLDETGASASELTRVDELSQPKPAGFLV